MYCKDHGAAMMGICKQRNDVVRFAVLREIPLTAMCKEERTMKSEIPASSLCNNLEYSGDFRYKCSSTRRIQEEVKCRRQ